MTTGPDAGKSTPYQQSLSDRYTLGKYIYKEGANPTWGDWPPLPENSNHSPA